MSRNYARLTSKEKDKRFKGTRTADLARMHDGKVYKTASGSRATKKSVKGEVRLGPKSGKIERVPSKTKKKHKRKYPLNYA
jgi:hypothetical protein